MRGGLVVALSIITSVGVACLVDVRPAHAQARTSEKSASDQRAHDLFVKGDAAYAEGRYEEALAAFEEAHELSDRPQLLYNISNALERLGRFPEAIEALDKYLASGKARDVDIVQKRLANLKKRVDEQKKAEEKAAREEEEKRQREAEERQREADARRAALAAKQVVRPPPPPPNKPSRVVPIALLGTGGAALVTGAVFGALTLSARSEIDSDCSGGQPGARLCPDAARSALDREQTFGIVADVAIVSGLVLGAVGTIWLLTSPGSKDKARAAVSSRGVDLALAF